MEDSAKTEAAEPNYYIAEGPDEGAYCLVRVYGGTIEDYFRQCQEYGRIVREDSRRKQEWFREWNGPWHRGS